MGNVVQFSGAPDTTKADRKKAARAQMLKVKAAARKAADAVEEFVNAVKLFHLEGYWLDLGYENAEACYKTELAPFLPSDGGPVRAQLFGTFKELGMSNVEIAAATGVSRETVRRSTSSTGVQDDDLGPDGEPDETDASDQAIEASDWPVDESAEGGPMDDTGEAYAEPDEAIEVEIVEPEIIDAEIVDEDDDGEPGFDHPAGFKTKEKPEHPLTEIAIVKVRPKITALANAIDKITIDSRYNGERRHIKAALRRDLEALRTVIDLLEGK